MPLPHLVARINKRVTNRLIEPVVARSRRFVRVRHVGRTSGATYSTPLLAFDHGDGSLVIALTYGPEADWVRNVRHGGARIEWNGDESHVESFVIVGRREAWPALPRIVRLGLRLLAVSDFALLTPSARDQAPRRIHPMSDLDRRAEPVPISATRPTALGRWWLRNRWDELAFVHHSYPPEVVQALLPDELTVDTFDGKAWVSLVPFQMSDATPRFLPAIPWISSFAETNVRTYVVDSAGNRAVWFFSLEASRLAIVAFARLLLGFPYLWSTMTIERHDGRRRYVTTKRRWPSTPASTTALTVEIGDVIDDPSDLDVFLTARWGTVARWPARRGRLRHHPVDHPEWTLRSAALSEYEDASFEAAGLPAPTSEPIVRYVDAIDARFGRPTRV